MYISIAAGIGSTSSIGSGGGAEESFVISVKTDNTGTSNDDQFTLPWIGTYDVNWGDGTSDSGVPYVLEV